MTSDTNNPPAETEFNPYAPPGIEDAPSSLPPDTEFLISDRYIACADNVHFPRVCVFTGARSQLVPWEQELLYSHRLVDILCVVFAFFALALGSAFLLAAGLIWWGRGRLGTKVRLHCYVSALELEVLTPRKRTRFILSVIQWACVLLSPVIFGAMLDGAGSFFGILAVVIFVAATVGNWFVRSPRLQVVGCVEKLYLIEGHSPEFTREVQSIIQQYNERMESGGGVAWGHSQ
ncbi:MAG: hypothetical protein KDA96_25800 [Planctomycetaceae bacterium]|nr:hypothetical protein [Planctomycetaceae bacterium]